MNPAAALSIEDLPTPSLLLDEDILRANLDFMQARATSLGVRLRPHVKTHKCLEIGALQRARGARGITVSTVEEARVFADAGFDDITWAFPFNPTRLDEVVEIARRADLGVTIDGPEALGVLERAGEPLSVWLEVDCGYGRSGVRPDAADAPHLVKRLLDSPSLRFRGCLTHAGHAYGADSPDRVAEIAEQERRAMVELADRLRGAGLDPGELSVGSTPGMSLVRSLDGIDEARPGNYALYDYTQFRLGACRIERSASSVLATVVSSRPGRDSCVADAGALVMSKDRGPDRPAHYGRIYADIGGGRLDEDLRIVSVSQEHAILSRALPVGTKVRIAPNHSCLTVARFDHFTVVRGTKVTDAWRIWRERGPRTQSLGPPRAT